MVLRETRLIYMYATRYASGVLCRDLPRSWHHHHEPTTNTSDDGQTTNTLGSECIHIAVLPATTITDTCLCLLSQ